MERVYLIVGEDRFQIQKTKDKILGKNENREVIHYDLYEDTIVRVIEDLDTFNFLTQEKVIVAENAYFLTSEKPKNAIEQDLIPLEKYIENPSLENILILTCNKLDERKGIVKKLKKNVKVIEASIDIMRLINDNLDAYQMSDGVKKYLLERTKNNYERTLNELEKLKLYKYDDPVITKEDIDSIVTKTIDDNIFNLIDAIIKKNKSLAFEIYEDMILHNEEPTKILILLANKFRLLYQVKILSKTIYRDEEIGKIIGSHPYPVKLAKGMVHDFSEVDLLSYLLELANIDEGIKTGKTYQNIALETFILTL